MKYLKGLRRLPQVLSRTEKIVITALLLITIGTSGLWWRHVLQYWEVTPVKGGVYTEGIIAATPQDIDLVTAKLTKIGLTYIDHQGKTHGALADHWDIQDDGKKYIFYLHAGLKASDIADTYSGLSTWQGITITPDDKAATLTMTLRQPFSPLLSFASDPVYDAGPYVLEKETTSDLIFTSNPKFVLGEPNLQRLVLTIYPDEKLLKAALQRQEIMAADIAIKGVSSTETKKLRLTKQTVLLFNHDRSFFKEKANREKVLNNQKFDQPTTLTLVTNQDPALLEKANEFAAKAKKLNLTINIKSVNPIVLDRDYVAKDDFDIIITDLNYGYDQDPYPFWHSSQIIPPGKNYAGYNSKEADKIIEEARQTIDQIARQKKYEDFNKLLVDDKAGIFYPNATFTYTISKRIKGITDGQGAVPTDRYTEIWRWYLKSKRTKT